MEGDRKRCWEELRVGRWRRLLKEGGASKVDGSQGPQLVYGYLSVKIDSEEGPSFYNFSKMVDIHRYFVELSD